MTPLKSNMPTVYFSGLTLEVKRFALTGIIRKGFFVAVTVNTDLLLVKKKEKKLLKI